MPARRKSKLGGPRSPKGELLRKRNGQFRKSPVRKSRSVSRRRTASRSRSRSVSRLSTKDSAKLRKLLGIRKNERIADFINMAQAKKLLKDLERKQSRSRSASKNRSGGGGGKRQVVNGKIIPTFKEVLDLFFRKMEDKKWCPKEVCLSVLEKFEHIRMLPQSPADLELIFSVGSTERKSINARCWICLYRAFRQRFHELNGHYPAADVDDDFANRFTQTGASDAEGVAGTFFGPEKEDVSGTASPAFAAYNQTGGKYVSTGERTPSGVKKWTLSAGSAHRYHRRRRNSRR